MNSFDVMKEMARRKMNIQLIPLSCIEQKQTRKSGSGFVKISVPNDTVIQLCNIRNMGGLLVIDAVQYQELEKELSANETI